MMTTPHDILARWPNKDAVRDDIRAGSKPIQTVAVDRWMRRNRIPAEYWLLLLEGANKRDIPLTLYELAEAHAKGANG